VLFNPPSRPLCGGRGSCGRFLDWHLQHYTKPIDRRSRRNGCKSSVGVALSEEGVLLFVFPSREPKEDGGRNATDCGRPFASGGLVSSGARFLPSPSLRGDSGTGKIGRQNSPGSQHCKLVDGDPRDG
jgi:hypothetical protein